MSHGGDIYRNKIEYDFSVNINPLLPPVKVLDALEKGLATISAYPDIKCEALRKGLAKIYRADINSILVGNGASEIFMAIVHSLKPRRAYIPTPSFFGYQWACNAENVERTDRVEDSDICFLANPGNPRGQYYPKDELYALIEKCGKRDITVVLDECFMELSDAPTEHSYTTKFKKYKNLIIVRAFTKSFAIPGLRLGYMMTGNDTYINCIRKHLPEWNVSGLAQLAGTEALNHMGYLEEARALIKKEREYLTDNLRKNDIAVEISNANFLLLFSKENLYEKLLNKGILIRDCSDFEGLKKGYYRIAVKLREENEILISALKEVLKG